MCCAIGKAGRVRFDKVIPVMECCFGRLPVMQLRDYRCALALGRIALGEMLLLIEVWAADQVVVDDVCGTCFQCHICTVCHLYTKYRCSKSDGLLVGACDSLCLVQGVFFGDDCVNGVVVHVGDVFGNNRRCHNGAGPLIAKKALDK